MPEPALLRDSEPSIAPVLALFRVVPAPLSSAGVLGGHIPALLGAPHCIRFRCIMGCTAEVYLVNIDSTLCSRNVIYLVIIIVDVADMV